LTQAAHRSAFAVWLLLHLRGGSCGPDQARPSTADPCLRPTVRAGTRGARPRLAAHFALYYINPDPSRASAGIVVGLRLRDVPTRGQARSAPLKALRAAKCVGKKTVPLPATWRVERDIRPLGGLRQSAPCRPLAVRRASPISSKPAARITRRSEQMAEEHEEHAGQDDRRRQGQDPRQDHVAHGRPLQP